MKPKPQEPNYADFIAESQRRRREERAAGWAPHVSHDDKPVSAGSDASAKKESMSPEHHSYPKFDWRKRPAQKPITKTGKRGLRMDKAA